MTGRKLAVELRRIFPAERVLTGDLERRIYNYDSSFMARFHNYLPDAVVLPRSTAEVSATLRLASKHGLPVVPRGAGSGETCGCRPVDFCSDVVSCPLCHLTGIGLNNQSAMCYITTCYDMSIKVNYIPNFNIFQILR